MRRLIKWDFRNSILKKRFFIMCAIIIVLTFVTMSYDLIKHTMDGYGYFIAASGNTASFIAMLAAIFAGISISGSYNDRTLQAAVCAGMRRTKIAFIKCFWFFVAVAVFYVIPVVSFTAISTAMYDFSGVPGSIGKYVISLFFLTLLTVFASASVYLPLTFSLKHSGAAVGIGIGVYAAINIISTLLAEYKPRIAEWLPWNQTILLVQELSTSMIFKTIISCFGLIVICIGFSIFQFNRTELK